SVDVGEKFSRGLAIFRIIHGFVLNAPVATQAPTGLVDDVRRECGYEVRCPYLRPTPDRAPETRGPRRRRIIGLVPFVLPLDPQFMPLAEVVIDSDVDLTAIGCILCST